MGGGKKNIVDRRFTREDANQKIRIHQIMLKYRPIAPRPVTAKSSCCSMTCVTSKSKYVTVKNKDKDKDNDLSKSTMTVRKVQDCKNLMSNVIIPPPKYLRDADVSVAASGGTSGCDVKNCNFFMSNAIIPPPKYLHVHDADVSVAVNEGTSCCDVKNCNFFMSNVTTPPPKYLHDTDLSVVVHGGHVLESWITTESLTCAYEDGKWLGYADDEIRKNLEKDSSPGFISNMYDEVEWVNLAYRRIGDPRVDGGDPPPDVVIWLAIKFEKLAPVKYSRCFSCRVRVEYEVLNRKSQMTVPCDVWKMDCGGYAWRLDVGAALCLGRIS